MNKIYFYIISTLLFISCKDTVDQMFYTGEISNFSISSKSVSLKAEKLKLDSAFFGDMYVYDSLLISQDHSQASHLFKVYNAFTQKFIGSFISRGQGNNEFYDVSPIYQLYEENKELKTLLFASNESKALIWNISKSIKEGKTVFENIYPYKWRNEHPSAYIYLAKINKDTFIGCIPGTNIGNDKNTIPCLQLRTLSTNKALRNITIYKEPAPEKNRSGLETAFLFDFQSCITPDCSKIIQTMAYLGHIDIIDVQTGEIKGLRLNTSDDFSIFLTDMKDAKHYYHRIQTNGKYILALWCGEKIYEKRNRTWNTLHVFDMNGKMLKQIKLNTAVSDIWIDPINNLLYGKNSNTEKIYRYKLNDAEL